MLTRTVSQGVKEDGWLNMTCQYENRLPSDYDGLSTLDYGGDVAQDNLHLGDILILQVSKLAYCDGLRDYFSYVILW